MTLLLCGVVGLVGVPAAIVALILIRCIREPLEIAPGIDDFRRFKG